jgi:hypothetical protein
MQKRGLTTLDASAAPPGIAVVKGEWPGVRMAQGNGDSAAGPTGVPWLDSNGWQVRLARIREPGKPVWIRTEFPKELRVFDSAAYLKALTDAAMYGGRWVMDLDPDLRKRIAGREKPALEVWNNLMAAQRFFAAHKNWTEYRAQGVVGILSDFRGGNEFTAGELLNLTARQHQPYRILVRVGQASWPVLGLQAIIYADAEVAPDTRGRLLAFAESGGLVITGGAWTEGSEAEQHPRYKIRRVGKGRIAAGDLSDPYQVAADAQILLSHRHDLVRFWNGGSLGSYLTESPAGKHGLLQIVNYAGRPGADPVSVRIAGPYREARIQQLGDAAPKPLRAILQKEAIELHLPAIPVYAAIELI